jgi:hypothetical protein
MAYFKDTQNKLHFLDNAQYEYLLPAGTVAISDAEAESVIAAQETVNPPLVSLTLEQLQAQLSTLTAQINALAAK